MLILTKETRESLVVFGNRDSADLVWTRVTHESLMLRGACDGRRAICTGRLLGFGARGGLPLGRSEACLAAGTGNPDHGAAGGVTAGCPS